MDMFYSSFSDFKKRFHISASFRSGKKVYSFGSRFSDYFYSDLDKNVVNSTYNTKIKSYPDGTENIYYAPTDLYGRFEHNKSFSKSKYDLFSIYYRSKVEHEKLLSLQLEQFENQKLIDVYFKSADNFLLACKSSRDYDKQLSYDYNVFNGLELSFDERKFLDSLKSTIRHDNLKRAKDSIFDLVYSNDWEYFFTGTIDPKKIDSSDPKSLKKPLQKWFNNMRSRYGLNYICIFERHKKSDGIHIHGLISSCPLTPLRLVPSDTKTYLGFKKPMKDSTARRHGLDPQKGQTVYNLTTWKFGFSTAIKVYGDRAALSNYITKYITKDNEKIMGRYYWHNRELKKPTITYRVSEISEIYNLPVYHGWRFELRLAPELQRKLHKYTEWVTIDYEEDNLSMEGWIDL